MGLQLALWTGQREGKVESLKCASVIFVANGDVQLWEKEACVCFYWGWGAESIGFSRPCEVATGGELASSTLAPAGRPLVFPSEPAEIPRILPATGQWGVTGRLGLSNRLLLAALRGRVGLSLSSRSPLMS